MSDEFVVEGQQVESEQVDSSEVAADEGLSSFVIEEESEQQSADKVEISRQEYEKLTREDTTNGQIAQALNKLADVTAPKPAAPVTDPFAVTLNGPEADALAGVEDDIFEKGKTVEAISKVVDARTNQKLAQMQVRINSSELRAQLAENPDIAPYASEVKQLIASVPADKKAEPGIVDAAIAHVRAAHSEEILNAKVDALVEKKIAERDAANPPPAAPKQPADFSEGLGSQGGAAAPRSTVTITKAEYAQYAAKAQQLGMRAVDYINNIVVPQKRGGKGV